MIKKDPMTVARENKEHSFSYRFSVIFLAINSFLCVVLLWMLFFPMNIIQPNVQPYKVVTKKVFAGQRFIYQVDACKYTDAQAVVERQFVSDVIYTLPATSGTVDKGCDKSNVSITVPDDIPEGRYHLELIVTYKLNFLRDATYYFKTEEFTILTPSKK